MALGTVFFLTVGGNEEGQLEQGLGVKPNSYQGRLRHEGEVWGLGWPRGQSLAPELEQWTRVVDGTQVSKHKEMGKDWPQLQRPGPPWPGALYSTFQKQED